MGKENDTVYRILNSKWEGMTAEATEWETGQGDQFVFRQYGADVAIQHGPK